MGKENENVWKERQSLFCGRAFARGAVNRRSTKLDVQTQDRFDLSGRLCIKLQGICSIGCFYFITPSVFFLVIIYVSIFDPSANTAKLHSASKLSISDVFIYALNQNSALTLSVDHSVPLKTAMMNDDRTNAFRNVSRKPGLQIWTVDVSLVSDSLMSYRLYSCIIRFVGFDFGRK